MNGRRWVPLLASLGLLLAACANGNEAVDTSPAPVPTFQFADLAAAPCDYHDAAPEEYHGRVDFTPMPAGDELVSVDRCAFVQRAVPGDGQWVFKATERVETGLAALTAALLLPSQPRPVNQTCTMEGRPQLVFTVTDRSGRSFTPLAPQLACGGPLPEVRTALLALPWQVLTTTRAWQVQTQLEIDTSCSPGYGNSLAYAAALGQKADPPARATVIGVPPLRVCRYALDRSAPPAFGPPGYPLTYSGILTSGSTVDGEPAGRLLAAIGSAPLADPLCSEPTQPFAVVTDGQGDFFMIELGGCDQMLDSQGSVRQLAPSVVAELRGRA